MFKMSDEAEQLRPYDKDNANYTSLGASALEGDFRQELVANDPKSSVAVKEICQNNNVRKGLNKSQDWKLEISTKSAENNETAEQSSSELSGHVVRCVGEETVPTFSRTERFGSADKNGSSGYLNNEEELKENQVEFHSFDLPDNEKTYSVGSRLDSDNLCLDSHKEISSANVIGKHDTVLDRTSQGTKENGDSDSLVDVTEQNTQGHCVDQFSVINEKQRIDLGLSISGDLHSQGDNSIKATQKSSSVSADSGPELNERDKEENLETNSFRLRKEDSGISSTGATSCGHERPKSFNCESNHDSDSLSDQSGLGEDLHGPSKSTPQYTNSDFHKFLDGPNNQSDDNDVVCTDIGDFKLSEISKFIAHVTQNAVIQLKKEACQNLEEDKNAENTEGVDKNESTVRTETEENTRETPETDKDLLVEDIDDSEQATVTSSQKAPEVDPNKSQLSISHSETSHETASSTLKEPVSVDKVPQIQDIVGPVECTADKGEHLNETEAKVNKGKIKDKDIESSEHKNSTDSPASDEPEKIEDTDYKSLNDVHSIPEETDQAQSLVNGRQGSKASHSNKEYDDDYLSLEETEQTISYKEEQASKRSQVSLYSDQFDSGDSQSFPNSSPSKLSYQSESQATDRSIFSLLPTSHCSEDRKLDQRNRPQTEYTNVDDSEDNQSQVSGADIRQNPPSETRINKSKKNSNMDGDMCQTRTNRPKSGHPRKRGQQQMVVPNNPSSNGRASPSGRAGAGLRSPSPSLSTGRGMRSPSPSPSNKGSRSSSPLPPTPPPKAQTSKNKPGPGKPPSRASQKLPRSNKAGDSVSSQHINSETTSLNSERDAINMVSNANSIITNGHNVDRPQSAMSSASGSETTNIFITDGSDVVVQNRNGDGNYEQDEDLTDSSSFQAHNYKERKPVSCSPDSSVGGPVNYSKGSNSHSEWSNDRLDRINEAAVQVSHLQENLQHMFREARSILTDYQSQLRTQSVTEFAAEVPEFTRTLTSLSDAYRSCESVTGGINEQLKDIRVVTNEICDLITHNFQSEGLQAWAEGTENGTAGTQHLKEEQEARQRLQDARIKEIKAISARAAAEAQSAHVQASQAEVEATQAEVAAANARQEAEVAIKRLNEVKQAAEEKKKAEQEAKRKAEELAKQKAEAEKKKKEEEERRLKEEARKKGTSIDDERKRVQDEKARIEAERKNPNNWPRYIYSIDKSDFDPGIGIVMRSQEGSLDREDLKVSLVDQLSGCLPCGESEELVSNILCVEPIDSSKSFKFEEPMAIAIPHCSPRIHPGREAVVKMKTSDDRVVTLPTADVMFDDIKDMRFVEVRLRRFGTMGVFLRYKKETLTFNRKGCKVMSSADSRVTLACQSGAFKNNISFALEVHPIDPSLIHDLKTKKPAECGQLLSSSPIITMHLPHQFSSPLTLTLPCPPNPALRPRRPQTAGNRLNSTSQENARPTSARPSFEGQQGNDMGDEVHLLRKDKDGPWTKLDGVVLNQSKKKDVVTFDMSQAFTKLAVIRTKPGVTNLQAEKMIGHLLTALTFKPISVIMRQKSAEPSKVTITCTQPGNTDRVIRALADEGFDHGPRPSTDIMLTEGQKLELRFRGNLEVTDDDARKFFPYNTHIPFRLDFNVKEHDKFSQRGFDSYRGFSQIYTTGKVKKTLDPAEERDRATGQRFRDEFVDGDILLCEQLIIIPKPDPETPRPLVIAPVHIGTEGIVNDELLRFLSIHLQYNDWKRLAQILNVKRCRIQAILRQNVNNEITETIYDMLVTWSKRLPRAMDRIDILSHAVTAIGRPDLAEELQVREEEFKQSKVHQSRDTYLRKAFITIAKNPKAVVQWKQLSRFLGVDESELQHIETTKESIQERCLTGLQRWRELNGEEATVSLLANKLRSCRYRNLAKQIESTT